jgi:hypothetical protein
MSSRLGLFLLLALLAISPAERVASLDAAKVLDGQWRWNQGNEVGDLKATFEPVTATSWKVSFSFNFDGPHVYTGTAEGSLAEGGRLEGRVHSDKGRREWRFEGTFKNGKLDGKHFEKRGREEELSGTLTLFR